MNQIQQMVAEGEQKQGDRLPTVRQSATELRVNINTVARAYRILGLRGPGMFWIKPIIESTPVWIYHRVMVTPFNAEKTLTKDTVPVGVVAVLFRLVWDAEKAALMERALVVTHLKSAPVQ